MLKKAATVIFATVVLVLLLASCTASDVPPGMQLASKPDKDGITLYLPTEYTVTRDATTGIISGQISKLDPTSIVAYVTYPSEATVEEYFENGLDPVRLGTDFLIEQNYPRTQKVADRDATVYVYSFKRDGTAYRTMQVFVPMGAELSEGVVILTYTAKSEPTVTGTVLYTKHLEGFGKVLEVLEIKNPSANKPSTVPADKLTLISDPDKVDYYFYVPAGWVNDPIASGMPSAYHPSDASTVSVVRYYPENVQSVAAYVQAVAGNYEEYFDSFTPPELIDQSGEEIHAYEALKVAGFFAYRYEFSGVKDGIFYRFSQIFILRNKGLTQGLYTVTLTASGDSAAVAEERHAAHASELAQMLAAFRFD